MLLFGKEHAFHVFFKLIGKHGMHIYVECDVKEIYVLCMYGWMFVCYVCMYVCVYVYTHLFV